MRTAIRHACRLGALLLAVWSLMGTPLPADAASASQIAAALKARNWYEDYGSFGNQVFGRVYVFGNHVTNGWFTGSYVTFKGVAGRTTLGMAWKPITNGVIIDYGFRRENITFTNYYSAYEAFVFVRGGTRGVLASTRSPLTPLSARRLFYR